MLTKLSCTTPSFCVGVLLFGATTGSIISTLDPCELMLISDVVFVRDKSDVTLIVSRDSSFFDVSVFDTFGALLFSTFFASHRFRASSIRSSSSFLCRFSVLYSSNISFGDRVAISSLSVVFPVALPVVFPAVASVYFLTLRCFSRLRHLALRF